MTLPSFIRPVQPFAATLLLSVGASTASYGVEVFTDTLTMGSNATLILAPTDTLHVAISTYLGANSKIINEGIFSTGGTLDGDPPQFTFEGSGLFESLNATFILENTKVFYIEGSFDFTAGVKFDLTGNSLPSTTAAVQTGSFDLGTVGAISGDFDTALTTVLGLGNSGGAVLISEAAGEGMTFNPSIDSVYWVQEDSFQVSLKYSIAPTPAPEPASAGLLILGSAGLLAVRRRR